MIHLTIALALVGTQVLPQPGPGDPRLQIVAYDPDQVVRLEVAPGYHLTVMFAPDERVESVALGDATAWQATANQRGDYLFIKPLTASTATNLTVVTDARVYSFELVPGYGGSTPFAVRFSYPAAAAPAEDAAMVEGDPVGRYRLRGDKSLHPDAIHDDGQRTYMSWPQDTSMPAVFAADARGEEILVDGDMIDGRYVVPKVYARLIFRTGNDRAFADRRNPE